MSSEPVVRDLRPEDAEAVARLHIEGIHKGFISSLGLKFTTALYEAIAASPYGFGYVVELDGRVVGFATWATDLGALYKSVLLRKGHKLIFVLARRLLSFKNIKRMCETLLYASRAEKMSFPPAEFLSMAISPEGRRKGLASQLVQKGFAECARRGVDKLKILACADLEAINKMYERLGFERVTQIESHGVLSNVYVVPTDFFQITQKPAGPGSLVHPSPPPPEGGGQPR
jgi:ribosomal protein S18 acetylase RimI-like enzyme